MYDLHHGLRWAAYVQRHVVAHGAEDDPRPQLFLFQSLVIQQVIVTRRPSSSKSRTTRTVRTTRRGR